MTTEQLPDGLKLADSIMSESDCISEAIDCARDAIRAEHQQRVKAERTLIAAGYIDHGGELWKPPLGPSASPLLERIAELEAERDEWRRIASAYSPQKELSTALEQAKASGRQARKERDELRAKYDELLVALHGIGKAQAVPDKWRLVPVEPTEKMIGEGACASCLPGPHYIGGYAARRAYVNMIAAAPEHKA